MKWSELFEFMIERDPAFAATVVGANESDLETCQRELDIVLPAAHVDFLCSMGIDSGYYLPFGPGMDSNFYHILRQIPTEDYDIRNYFPIALETDSSRCPMFDLYLDLSRPIEADAIVLEAENGSDWTPRKSDPITLLERLTESAWRTFEAPRHAANRMLNVRVDPGTDFAPVRALILATLENLGHTPVLPRQKRFDCLGTKTEASIVHLQDQFRIIQVIIAANDEKQLSRVVESFLDNVPQSSIDERMPSLPLP